jgi:hypothetical protein
MKKPGLEFRVSERENDEVIARDPSRGLTEIQRRTGHGNLCQAGSVQLGRERGAGIKAPPLVSRPRLRKPSQSTLIPA